MFRYFTALHRTRPRRRILSGNGEANQIFAQLNGT
jgi:hypothetical protein